MLPHRDMLPEQIALALIAQTLIALTLIALPAFV